MGGSTPGTKMARCSWSNLTFRARYTLWQSNTAAAARLSERTHSFTERVSTSGGKNAARDVFSFRKFTVSGTAYPTAMNGGSNGNNAQSGLNGIGTRGSVMESNASGTVAAD